MHIRKPAVAGSFYEARPERLEQQVDELLPQRSKGTRRPFIAAVVPHAGLMYSGHVAGALYEQLEFPETVIILCPNHTGLGADAAIQSSGSWLTPLGEMQIDQLIATALMEKAPILTEDSLAHLREHSLEVQLPFIQRLAPATRFVPICIGRPDLRYCVAIGEAVADVIREASASGKKVGIIASTDLNHYENQKETLRKDQLAIDEILRLEGEKLWYTVIGEDISMCGFIPTTTALLAAKRLGAQRATLVRHATSGDISGDYDAVVGYASVLID